MRRISSNSNQTFNFSFPEFLYRIRGRASPSRNRNRDVEKGINSSAATSTVTNSNKQNNENEAASPKCNSTSNNSSSNNNNSCNTNNKASTSTLPTNASNECQLCYMTYEQPESFYTLENSCRHRACKSCLVEYLTIEILESRTDISCPSCPEKLNPIDIQILLQNKPNVVAKYEEFMIRRVLLSEPDSRFCPGPDCTYVVIATGCASCPLIRCQRPSCGVQFCYHCKDFWHENQTCDAARRGRQSGTSRRGSSEDSQHRDQTIKPCPRCNVLIVKMDDGSCNHMVCAVCGSEFCWLCMKEITDLHYLSPSGCTFWGTKPWSRKKKLLWQLGTLVGAPVGIALVAGIAVPAMIIGIPVWIARKVFGRYKKAGKKKRFCLVFLSSLVSILVSPILAGLAVAIGIPVLLFYIYGVVPISLCRQSCAQNSKYEFDDEEINGRNAHEDAISKNLSIGEVSLSVGSHFRVGGNNSLSAFQPSSSIRESTTALNGSINREALEGHKLEVQADVSLSETASCQSTRALAGSLLNYKSSTNAEGENNSERVRFDNQDINMNADKSSLGSGRSFKSSERSYRDDLESSKKLSQRIPKLSNSQNRACSEDNSSCCIDSKIDEDEQEDEKKATQVQNSSPLKVNNINEPTTEVSSTSTSSVSETSLATKNNKNLSKTKILRNLFFFQKDESS